MVVLAALASSSSRLEAWRRCGSGRAGRRAAASSVPMYLRIFCGGFPHGGHRAADEVVEAAGKTQAESDQEAPRLAIPAAVGPGAEQGRQSYRCGQLDAETGITEPLGGWSSTVRHTPPGSDDVIVSHPPPGWQPSAPRFRRIAARNSLAAAAAAPLPQRFRRVSGHPGDTRRQCRTPRPAGDPAPKPRAFASFGRRQLGTAARRSPARLLLSPGLSQSPYRQRPYRQRTSRPLPQPRFTCFHAALSAAADRSPGTTLPTSRSSTAPP